MSRRRQGANEREGRVLRFVRRPADLDPLQHSERPDVAFEGKWRDNVKRRTIVVLAFLLSWAAAAEARLVQLQVADHDKYQKLADKEQNQTIQTVAVRGDITDRYGSILAYSVPATAIVATPRQIKDAAVAVTQVCWALGDCTAAYRAEMLSKFSTPSSFAYVRHADSVTPDQAARMATLKLEGIELFSDTQRYYPNYELAAHLIGFVGKDNTGLGGVEHALDAEIRGQQGVIRVLQDSHGKSMQSRVEATPTVGAQVELTIDQRIQHIVERELAAGVAEHHANSGMCVVMDPNTGEILALANVPTFNPNAFDKATDDERRNRALQDAYEPGSTMKIVTISAALENRIVTPESTYDTDPGYLQIGIRKIHDAEGKNNGVLSVRDIVVHSSNVGAGKIGLQLGAERLEQYVRRFGFGQTLLPGLKGQTAGRVFGVSELNDSALASMAIGYQISVTPVQMAATASVVANGGTLMEPHVVRAIIRDGVREEFAPKALRRVISPETAATMTSILEDVVKRGTGIPAALDGYTVAGKTGTAAKLVDHVYSTTAYNASFVGFVPSRHPAVTIIVVIDWPHTGGTHGGEVAAPVFKKIAEATMRELHIAPTLPTVPVVTRVAENVPPKTGTAPTIVLPVSGAAGPRMPDVRGKTPREAVHELVTAGLFVHMNGNGAVVTSQMPQAGDPIEPGSTGTLQFGKPALSPAPASAPALDVRLAGGGVR